jgi:hypothetical protein
MILNLEPRELDYIAQVLSRQPWLEVNTLLINIQQQVNKQQETHHADGRSESSKLASVSGSG